MLNLKHLYYFYVFGQELSITKAAERLRLTPPALSNQLKVLENFLGFKLYIRENGNTRLTSQGKTICKYANKIFSPYEELLHHVRNAKSGGPNIF
jgi:LysR family transcriptional regulator, salicylic acid-responsive activator of bsdBCD